MTRSILDQLRSPSRGRKSALDITRNFIELYTYVAGDWKTPLEFHRWAAISLIGACLEDRVWLSIFDHAPLHPNVWVFLIGRSGVGKDHAIGLALNLIQPEDPIVKIDGKVTIPALYDFLALTQKTSGKSSAPVYLISSDVTEQLPLGIEAKEFTSRVLALYGGRDRDLMDLTRTSGKTFVHKPLLNWLAGCTPQWFPMAIDPMVFSSGFAGRGFFIMGEPDTRYAHLMRPIARFDKPLIMDHLRQRLELLQQVEGGFTLSRGAQAVIDGWLQQHAFDSQILNLSDAEREVVGRQLAAAEKLAMIFAMADWAGGDLKIRSEHMMHALRTAGGMTHAVKLIADFAFQTTDTMIYEKVKDAIRNGGEKGIQRKHLLKIGLQRGVRNAKHLDEIVDTLKQAGHIDIGVKTAKPGGGPRPRVFKWRGQKILLGGKNGKAEAIATALNSDEPSSEGEGVEET